MRYTAASTGQRFRKEFMSNATYHVLNERDQFDQSASDGPDFFLDTVHMLLVDFIQGSELVAGVGATPKSTLMTDARTTSRTEHTQLNVKGYKKCIKTAELKTRPTDDYDRRRPTGVQSALKRGTPIHTINSSIANKF